MYQWYKTKKMGLHLIMPKMLKMGRKILKKLKDNKNGFSKLEIWSFPISKNVSQIYRNTVIIQTPDSLIPKLILGPGIRMLETFEYWTLVWYMTICAFLVQNSGNQSNSGSLCQVFEWLNSILPCEYQTQSCIQITF